MNNRSMFRRILAAVLSGCLALMPGLSAAQGAGRIGIGGPTGAFEAARTAPAVMSPFGEVSTRWGDVIGAFYKSFEAGPAGKELDDSLESFKGLNFSDPATRASLAPMIYVLEYARGVTAEKFATLKPSEQQSLLASSIDIAKIHVSDRASKLEEAASLKNATEDFLPDMALNLFLLDARFFMYLDPAQQRPALHAAYEAVRSRMSEAERAELDQQIRSVAGSLASDISATLETMSPGPLVYTLAPIRFGSAPEKEAAAQLQPPTKEPARQVAPATDSGFKPAYKIIAELEALADQPEAAMKAATAVLDDPSSRPEARVGALRLIGSLKGVDADQIAKPLLKVIEDDKSWVRTPETASDADKEQLSESNKKTWLVAREAMWILGDKAPSIVAEKESAIKSLFRTHKGSDNSPLQLIAGETLRKFGVDPDSEIDPATIRVKPSLLGRMASVKQKIKAKIWSETLLGRWLRKSWAFLLVFGLAASIIGARNFIAPAPMTKAPSNPPAIVEVVNQKPVEPAAPFAEQAAPEQVQSKDPVANELKKMAQEIKRSSDAAEQTSKSVGMLLRFGMILGGSYLLGQILRPFLGRFSGRTKGQEPAGPNPGLQKKPIKSNIRFSDVAGIEDAYVELQEIVKMLKEPGNYVKMGAKMPKGYLLDGRPGTGKTLLVKAVANEAGVPFFSMSGSEFVEKFVGVGAARVRELFAAVRAHESAIVFIDEIDAIGRARSGAGDPNHNDEREQTLNQILTEMDGINTTGQHITVIAATNRPDVLDPGLTRSGRFDRKIHVNLPDVYGREAILAIYARNVRLSPKADLRAIARRTAGLAGADLETVVNEAAMFAGRRSADAVETSDLEEGIDRVVMGPRSTSFVSAEHKRLTAYHEAGHVLAGISKGATLRLVTVIPRGSAGGFTDFGDGDQPYLTRSDMLRKLMIFYGGRAAEELINGETSTGPSNDLTQATKLARDMVTRFGMSQKVGPVVYNEDAENPFGGQGRSEKTKRTVDEEVKKLLEEAAAEASSIVTRHRAILDDIAQALIERETMTGDEVQRIVAGRLPLKEVNAK